MCSGKRVRYLRSIHTCISFRSLTRFLLYGRIVTIIAIFYARQLTPLTTKSRRRGATSYRRSCFQSVVKHRETSRYVSRIDKHDDEASSFTCEVFRSLETYRAYREEAPRAYPVKISTPMWEISAGDINRWHAGKPLMSDRRRSPLVTEEQTLTCEIVRSVEFMLTIQYFFSRKGINSTLHSSIMKIRCKCDCRVLRSRSLNFLGCTKLSEVHVINLSCQALSIHIVIIILLNLFIFNEIILLYFLWSKNILIILVLKLLILIVIEILWKSILFYFFLLHIFLKIRRCIFLRTLLLDLWLFQWM